jgi:acyl-CoA synthetase (NDP forming)
MMLSETLEPLPSGYEITSLFSPRSIAVVGVSHERKNAGQGMLLSLLKFGYRGALYAVGLHGGQISGIEIYRSILDISGPVDYVICCIPADATLKFMEDCIRKGVGVVHIFASGFSESGNARGRKLERKLVDIARSGGVRVLGPNCLGIFSPREGMTFYDTTAPFLIRSGAVGFFCQSGGNTRELIETGTVRGIHFSKGVSYGNGSDLNESDFLQFFARDEETKVIGGYIEGVKNGRNFFETLQGIASIKPTIIFKGGQTMAGKLAAATHTGSLSGTAHIWEVVCRQSGAILVNDLDEMMDLMLVFSCLRKEKTGRKVGIVSVSGGRSVQCADIWEKEGFSIPYFPLEVQRELHLFTPEVGTSTRNPLDAYVVFWDASLFSRALKVLSEYRGIDYLIIDVSIILSLTGIQGGGAESLRAQIEAIVHLSEQGFKRLIVVLPFEGVLDTMKLGFELEQRLIGAGIPVYPTMLRAASVLKRFVGYCENGSS